MSRARSIALLLALSCASGFALAAYVTQSVHPLGYAFGCAMLGLCVLLSIEPENAQ